VYAVPPGARTKNDFNVSSTYLKCVQTDNRL
jgi:hypothetical protein